MLPTGFHFGSSTTLWITLNWIIQLLCHPYHWNTWSDNDNNLKLLCYLMVKIIMSVFFFCHLDMYPWLGIRYVDQDGLKLIELNLPLFLHLPLLLPSARLKCVNNNIDLICLIMHNAYYMHLYCWEYIVQIFLYLKCIHVHMCMYVCMHMSRRAVSVCICISISLTTNVSRNHVI